VEASVKSRTSYGGTAPKNVLSQAKAWAKAAGKKSENKPEEKISLQFHGLSVAHRHSPERGNLCMVRRALGISS
jgi:hypothetical protein